MTSSISQFLVESSFIAETNLSIIKPKKKKKKPKPQPKLNLIKLRKPNQAKPLCERERHTHHHKPMTSAIETNGPATKTQSNN